MWRIRRSLRLAMIATLSVVMLLAVACGDDDDIADVAQDTSEQFTGSPTASAGQDEGTEELVVTIEDGEFADGDIQLQQNQPTILLVENRDDVAYRLTIGELVVNEGLPAGTTTRVEFTTPVVEDYPAELLPAEGEEALDTMEVRVIGPGGTGG